MPKTPLVLLSPDRWPFSLDWLPPTAYLVGGAVRDALLGRQGDYLDLDFVLPELAVETARKIASRCQAGFVLLDRERQIARVVFQQATVDFAQQEGESLEADLKRRDFTANAIAYNPHRGELLDPLKGLADLDRKTLRMVSQANLEDDPLRLLRAYRQAAQLNFTIEPATRAAIRSLTSRLSTVAAERVRTELNYLLANPQGSDWLMAAGKDGVLQPWLKQVTAEKLRQAVAVERAARGIRGLIGEDKWHQWVSPSGKVIPLAKLASLVPSTPEAAAAELMTLKYSRGEVRTVVTALKHLPPLRGGQPQMSLREQYFFFLDLGKVFPVLALLAVAAGVSQAAIAPLIDRYLDPEDPVAHPQALVNGNDLIERLNLRPSPSIGHLLTEIQLARIEGKISTPEDAFQLAASLSTSVRNWETPNSGSLRV